ncbi:Tic20 family protein [Lyngbya confervoides]|uniref:Tic20 family protein n=1 Tax=Lyngbya confervoides BDU141951 TaxID=1574623 RepID=A0ABD4T1D9_9CYAN|nr:Tic20 family protein [Lyngbya confervoides]MCM1982298.1 hypothetical protein [Lyngbya confervoides BDU141951]
MTWRGTTTPSDRIFASLPYLLVLFHALPFRASVLTVFPALSVVLEPLLLPLLLIYTIPFAGLVIFLGLFLLVVRNERISHFVRFNTMQALLLTIVLFLAQLILGLLPNVEVFGLMVRVFNSTIFLGVLGIFVYAVVQSMRGLYTELPTISEAVYSQVR